MMMINNNEGQLIDANKRIGITDSDSRGIIFVYTPPKVGSTSIVSCVRLFASNKFKVIHLHDEHMLKSLTNISDVTINDIIQYNSKIGKNVYVVDVYRSPIERKMSLFFEHISSLHFNTSDEEIRKYDLNKIATRFNKIFAHVALEELFLEKYDIPTHAIPEEFDVNKKYLLIEHNGVKYVKLRLKDSSSWGTILSNIFETKIQILKENDASNKTIGGVYNNFKMHYKIPANLLQIVKECPYLKYYYSEEERNEYLTDWSNRQTNEMVVFSKSEYNVYNEISIDNSWRQSIEFDHYVDNGCVCEGCNKKRAKLVNKVISSKTLNPVVAYTDRIVHQLTKKTKMLMSIKK
jgi:hypothetical protein